MNKHEDKLEAKIDKISKEISKINITLAKQHVTLDEHIKRTELLEKRVKPIEDIITAIHTSSKLTSYVMGLIGFLASLAEIIRYVRK